MKDDTDAFLVRAMLFVRRATGPIIFLLGLIILFYGLKDLNEKIREDDAERKERRAYLERERLRFQRDAREKQRERALREKRERALREKRERAARNKAPDARADRPDCYLNTESAEGVRVTVDPDGRATVRMSGCETVTVGVTE
jgi:phosphomannomutase